MTQTTASTTASSAAPDDVGAPVVQDGFDAVVAPLRRELLAHCYRMTGSLQDAEDALQETWLRAWRALPDFEGRSSLRTWMYRIATRVCLSHLEGRARRPLPVGLGGPPADPAVEPRQDRSVPWLEPLPDRVLWSTPGTDPADRAVDVDTVRLAFVAALQHLTAQQRAVLLLRDVLAWTAAEVAQALRLSVAAVNSTLQRAHARMATLDVPPAPGELTPHQQHLLRRYVAAFEAYDVPALVTLLAADVVWEMPPYPEWYQGPDAVGNLICRWCPATGPGSMRLLGTSSNGLPTFGLYMREADGRHHAFQLQQVTVGPDGVQRVTVWFAPELFGAFGLPDVVPPDEEGRH